MASNNSNNQINVPEAREAMRNMKHEVANELGITLNQGYNGNLSSKDAGHIGGNMVKNVLPIRTREHSLVVDKRFIGRRLMPVHYRMRLAL
ncbi:MAG: alpha/beta-type small acid-soluble spore protein [Oscillospiraceae bacterium]|nr:alpha/beta-type small acid-soluble spore protein [Clostridia bacterium]MBR3239019.1 alpha/beta-type small acid-soluble spore protein [Oscillospiraceae bacterium]